MRYAIGALLLLSMLSTSGCPTSGTIPRADASTGDDGGLGLINEGDGGVAVQPFEAGACSDPSHCLSGTATLDPLFAVGCVSPQCTTWQVDLFDRYPAGNVRPIGPPALIGANDNGWVFDAVGAEGGASPGYYVQATAVFVYDGGHSVVTAVVGPLTVPATQVAINVAPMQAVAYEARVTGGPTTLDWVLARLYDPSSGAPITSGAQVSVQVEAGAVSLDPMTIGSSTAYYTSLSPPAPAQPTYLVTASHPAFGDAGYAVELVADPPAFDGMITSVDAGAGGTVQVAWTAEPQADYEVVELYAAEGDGGWVSVPVFTSPSPDPPSQTSETTGPLDAGTYLVNVAYTRANCPADAGGCLQAATVAATTTTVK